MKGITNMTNIPKELYHYTSLDAFYSIIQSGTLRATEISGFDDPLEYEFGKRLLERAYNELGAKNVLANHDLNLCNPTTYVISLTDISDYLPFWKEYANNGLGISIGLDCGRVISNAKIEKVEYFSKSEARKFIELRISELVEKNVNCLEYADFDEFIEYFPLDYSVDGEVIDYETIDRFPEFINSQFREIACKIKQFDFKYEHEYRVIINYNYNQEPETTFITPKYGKSVKYINTIWKNHPKCLQIREFYPNEEIVQFPISSITWGSKVSPKQKKDIKQLLKDKGYDVKKIKFHIAKTKIR